MTSPNREQRQALESMHKKVLLIAAAGTGKTELLAFKAIREAGRINANRRQYNYTKPYVLVLTHTTNARDRILQRIHASEPNIKVTSRIKVYTFQGFALKTINNAGLSRYTIDSECDERILRQIFTEGVLLENNPDIKITDILSVFEDQKNYGRSLKQVINRRHPHLKKQRKSNATIVTLLLQHYSRLSLI